MRQCAIVDGAMMGRTIGIMVRNNRHFETCDGGGYYLERKAIDEVSHTYDIDTQENRECGLMMVLSGGGMGAMNDKM